MDDTHSVVAGDHEKAGEEAHLAGAVQLVRVAREHVLGAHDAVVLGPEAELDRVPNAGLGEVRAEGKLVPADDDDPRSRRSGGRCQRRGELAGVAVAL